MRERRYLLNIEQMLGGSEREILLNEAFDRIDRERRQKLLSVKKARARAAGIGAGLLIQKALADYRTEHEPELQACRKGEHEPDLQTGQKGEHEPELQTGRKGEHEPDLQTGQKGEHEPELQTGQMGEHVPDLQACRKEEHMPDLQAEQSVGQLQRREQSGVFGAAAEPVLECFSVEELLAVLNRKAAEPCYRYGKNGKPYLTDHAFQFNLSHSGDYVFCGVSEQEIGVDIQKIQGNNGLCLAKRFFSGSECRALEACGDEELRRQLFFRMWVRKEAYGKLTGEGIPGALDKCLWGDFPAGEELSVCKVGNGFRWENDLVWEEYEIPGGYRMAVCRFRQ